MAEPAWLRERRARAWQALARLPAGQRQVIELAYFGGLTRAEVAAQLGVPLGTATTWLRLGLHTLQELDRCE